MFTRVEARRFRSLKAVEHDIGAFRALVGPNGSGKTTFLDVVAFLGDLMRNRGDVRETVFDRSFNYQKLLWLEQGADFQLAVEAQIPDGVRASMAEDKQRFSHVRYQVQIGFEESCRSGRTRPRDALASRRRSQSVAAAHQTHGAHQPADAAACDGDAVAAQLPPHLARPVHLEVLGPDPTNLSTEFVVTTLSIIT